MKAFTFQAPPNILFEGGCFAETGGDRRGYGVTRFCW